MDWGNRVGLQSIGIGVLIGLVVAWFTLMPRIACAQDGGTVMVDPTAGVYRVDSALTPNGTELGRGWWLSDERIKRTGDKVVSLENENAALYTVIAISIAVGFAGGVAATVFVRGSK